MTVDPVAATRFLNPKGADRKKKVLAVRANAGPRAMKAMQTVKNKGTTKATMKNMGSAQADAKRSKQADAKRKQLVIEPWRMPLTNGSISGPTSEANPRCELVAYYGQLEGRNTKLHTWTSTVRSWGLACSKTCGRSTSSSTRRTSRKSRRWLHARRNSASDHRFSCGVDTRYRLSCVLVGGVDARYRFACGLVGGVDARDGFCIIC